MTAREAADRCVACGFCLQSCPTYRIFLSEESSPRGRIALATAVLDGEMPPTARNLATFAECLGCRACESACPSGVPYDEVRSFGRQALRAVEGPLPVAARLVLTLVAAPWRLALARSLWRTCGRVLKALSQRIPGEGAHTLLAAAPPATPSPDVAEDAAAAVAIHRGCLMEVFWAHTNARAVALLQEAGMPARRLPQRAGCCGALSAHQGDVQAAKRLARRTIEAFEASAAEMLVSLAGGCGAFMKEYPVLFADDPAWRERAGRLAAAGSDMATLLADRLPPPRPSPERVTYQDSCHLRHGLKVVAPPRRLLADAADYVEMPGADECCGSAGLYNLVRPDVARAILAGKVRDLAATGATTLVVTNPGCELQMRLAAKKAGSPVTVRHLVDYLFEARKGGRGAGEGM